MTESVEGLVRPAFAGQSIAETEVGQGPLGIELDRLS